MFQTQQTNPPKNQKSIISFFKNNGEGNSQDAKLPVKNSIKNEVNESVKRKATSPVSLDLEFVDKNDTPLNIHNTPKKLKTETCNSVSLCKKTGPNSPNKENSCKTESSSRASSQDLKASKNQETPLKKLSFLDQQEFEENNFETKTGANRRPLTPVTVISENHDSIKNEILNITNHEEESHRNHVNSNEHNHKRKKRTTPKKSPSKSKLV